jgi:putative tryptophan/tyrosine transport system substrate-binding protein
VTDALCVWSEPLTNANKSKIIKAATAAKIPTIFGFREFVDAGGLISYGPNFTDLFARAAEFTDKILRGATPADMPVQQPVKFDLIINLKAAKALGLNISETVLTRADEVIEISSPLLRRMGPEMVRLRHADCIALCPLPAVTRKTFARTEFFRL